jgi:hypothetical protein
VLNTGSTPNPTGVLLSITDSQGHLVENGTTDRLVGATWDVATQVNQAWGSVNSASDLLYQYGVIPASAMTSQQVTLTVSTTANGSGQRPLVHGVDWITVAPWRWDAGALYDQLASPNTPAQVAPRQVTTTVG